MGRHAGLGARALMGMYGSMHNVSVGAFSKTADTCKCMGGNGTYQGGVVDSRIV